MRRIRTPGGVVALAVLSIIAPVRATGMILLSIRKGFALTSPAKLGFGAISILAIATAIGLLFLTLGPSWTAYTVQGHSMEPEFQPGDLIITSREKAAAVQTGEIIVFVADWASDKYDHRVVHRVVATGKIDGQHIAYTRGDANSLVDPQPVNLDQGIRVVRYRLHSGGLLARIIAGPFMLATVATLAAGMLGAALSTGAPIVVSALRQLRRTRGPDAVPTRATDLRIPY